MNVLSPKNYRLYIYDVIETETQIYKFVITIEV